VRDIVAGYAVALRGGQPGTAYNLGSGAGRTIREIAELVCARAGVELRIERRPERARSDDVSCIVADASRLAGLGWEPRRDLGATIADMLAAPTT
jgi:GDP-4-dehydro-6-deoxy-D-mannose reductase